MGCSSGNEGRGCWEKWQGSLISRAKWLDHHTIFRRMKMLHSKVRLMAALPRIFVIFNTGLLFGCSAASEYSGEVIYYEGRVLTISGPLNQVQGKEGIYPTPAMQLKADRICGGSAQFENVETSNPLASTSTSSMYSTLYMNYNFLCL